MIYFEIEDNELLNSKRNTNSTVAGFILFEYLF